jgi:hypothetical protein
MGKEIWNLAVKEEERHYFFLLLDNTLRYFSHAQQPVSQIKNFDVNSLAWCKAPYFLYHPVFCFLRFFYTLQR